MAITDYPITSTFHEIDKIHSQPHSGIDVAVPYGTPIISQDGGIVSITHDKWLGDAVKLHLKNGDVIVYGHLSRVDVVNGQHINVNQLIGLSGGLPNSNQGRSTAPHVHISQYHDGQLIDPTNYIFHHEQIQNNNISNSSLFIIPVMLILLFIVLWRFRKPVLYVLGVIFLLSIIFIVS